MRAHVVATLTALSLPLALVACTSKTESAAGDITVTADDSTCALSRDTAETGTVTFRITNGGSKVTEFYVYDSAERVVGEIENIGPGLTRQLIVSVGEPGTYRTACKPGMVGDGIRHDFTVTGAAKPANASPELAAAAAAYKQYLTAQIATLQDSTKSFVDAVRRGDIPAAKQLFPVSRTYWERIEPAAEAFPNDLDPRVDQREADLSPGDAWTGFHRLEKDLWVQGLQPDTTAIADRLQADISELAGGVNASGYVVDPVQVAGGAQSLLDEVARTKITGEEDIFSHTDLWDFQGNVEGSKAAIASVRPILDARNPDLGAQIDRRFAELEAELAKYRAGDGFVSYDTVTADQRAALARHIDALSAVVSQVQGIVAQS
ncbi:iron uptake system protein EfeO [Nocardia thailandica]|uniref:Iron uptake system protein EfeO n=1 Tax=Nocardia thailandica TaxID=257275 RepID=A0ABW6PRE8_9NOCA